MTKPLAHISPPRVAGNWLRPARDMVKLVMTNTVKVTVSGRKHSDGDKRVGWAATGNAQDLTDVIAISLPHQVLAPSLVVLMQTRVLHVRTCRKGKG